MRKVIPTIFAHTKKEFNERCTKLTAISKELQIDFMDGRFASSKGISIHDVPDLKKFKNRSGM